MLQIVKVELQSAQHLLHRVGIAIVERGVGSNAWPNLIEERVALVVLHNLVDVELAFGSWSDESHVATENVPQLWQLVKMVVAQEPANLRHAMVALMAEQLWSIFLGI